MQMRFSKLARLLYRDTVEQKHQERDRLLKEIKDFEAKIEKTNPSKQKAKAIADTKIPSTPLAEVLIKHILAVTCHNVTVQ